MKTIDAQGISCPEPLLMLQKALKTENEILLQVDSKNALDNCESYAKGKGFTVETTILDEEYEVRIAAAK